MGEVPHLKAGSEGQMLDTIPTMGGTNASFTLMNDNEPLVPSKPNQRINLGERTGVGGTFSHEPLCKCRPCAARRRQQEALASGTGNGRMPLASEYVPTPKAVTDKNGIKRALPKDIRTRVAQFLQLSMAFPNCSRVELAEKMGIGAPRLYEIIQEGRESGLIVFTDPLERIDYEIIPKIITNLNYFLDAKDKTVTIEAAKGTLFRTYQEARGISDTTQTVLALKIEMPDGHEVKVLTGHIVGKPKGLCVEDDNIIEAESHETQS